MVTEVGPGPAGAVKSGIKEDSTAGGGAAVSESPCKSTYGEGCIDEGVLTEGGGCTDSNSGLLTKKLLCHVWWIPPVCSNNLVTVS